MYAALEVLAGARFVRGNRVELLRSGTEYFPAIFDALIAARYTICIEMYAIWDGAVCSRLCRILSDRAMAGISVRLVADAVGSRAWSKVTLNELRQAGAHVVLHNPPSLRSLTRFGLRTHRKLIVVDDEVAFIGGFNFVDVFAETASATPWLDYVVEMEGPIVVGAQATFERSWQRVSGSSGDLLAETASAHAGLAQALLIDSPTPSGKRTVRAMHEAVIAAARRRVSIRNPFFLPDDRMLQTIAAAIQRGVDVRIIVPGRRMPHRVLLDANRIGYGVLLDLGARLFEFEPSMMHAKTMMVDETFSLLGSANFDPRSIGSNNELTVAIVDESFASSMEAHFDADLRHCTEVVEAGLDILTPSVLRRILPSSLMRFL